MDGKSVEISENQKNRNQKIVSNSSNEKPRSNRGIDDDLDSNDRNNSNPSQSLAENRTYIAHSYEHPAELLPPQEYKEDETTNQDSDSNWKWGTYILGSLIKNSSSDESNIHITNIHENPPEPVTPQEEESDKIKPETSSLQLLSNFINRWSSVSKKISNQDELVPIQSWEPQGFPILFDQCYFNSVLQSLVSCEEFRKALMTYEPSFLNISRDQNFVRGLSCLIRGLKNKNENKVRDALSTIQSNYTESAFGDDILKCFTNILNRISNVIGYNSQENPNSSVENVDKAEMNFRKQKNRNKGFVFDNFYGQLGYQIICKRCKHVVNESFQVMKSLLLPIPNSSGTVTLDMCIEEFFKDSDIENDIPMSCKCDNGTSIDLELRTRITHIPRYFFMYLNRGSYNNERKKETNVKSELVIKIKTGGGEEVIYELISVIDHVGTNENGHYYCKCCYDGETWWCLNDSNVRRMTSSSGVVCRDSIGFIFKKHE